MKLKDKMLKYRVMESHKTLVQTGNYSEARLVLRLLNNGSVKLRLDDVSWNVECLMEAQGCAVGYSRRFNIATVYLVSGKRREWK